jgi:hypothetical protein
MRDDAARTLYTAKDRRGEACFLLYSKGETAAVDMAAFYRALEGNDMFTDFIESFSYGDGRCGVFRNALERGDKRFDEFVYNSSMRARLDALRSVIAGFVLQRTPYGMICDLLAPDNLYFSASGDVRFVYDIGQYSAREGDMKNAALTRLSDVAREMGPDPLSPALEQFADSLENYSTGELSDIYAAAAEAIDKTDDDESVPLPDPSVRIRDRIESFMSGFGEMIGPLIVVCVFLLAVAVLCYLVKTQILSPYVDNEIARIGTVEVPDAN